MSNRITVKEGAILEIHDPETKTVTVVMIEDVDREPGEIPCFAQRYLYHYPVKENMAE